MTYISVTSANHSLNRQSIRNGESFKNFEQIQIEILDRFLFIKIVSFQPYTGYDLTQNIFITLLNFKCLIIKQPGILANSLPIGLNFLHFFINLLLNFCNFFMYIFICN
jgi:hypothetical protein